MIDVLDDKPTHHISLIDGDSNEVGLILCDGQGNSNPRGITKTPMRRIGMKIQQGDTEHSDFELPWQDLKQDDWSGGRGKLDYETGRYWHGYMVNTMHDNKAFLGPQPQLTTGYRDFDEDLFGDTSYQAVYGTDRYIGVTFPAGASYDSWHIEFYLQRTGTPNGVLTVELRSDSAGDPGAVLKSDTFAVTTGLVFIPLMHQATFASAQALTATTDYWVVIHGHASDDADNHFKVGVNPSGSNSKKSSDGSSWSAATYDLRYRVTDAYKNMRALFFDYKGATYFVTNRVDGTAGKLYINGDRGQATGAQTSTTLKDTGKTWTVNEHQNKIVQLPLGTGRDQRRVISSNTVDTLTISPAWQTTPVTADTEYVIVSDDTWTEISTTGLAKPVTDVQVSKDVVYFAQGEATNIRRFNYAAGTNSFADDGTNKATFLELVHESGGAKVCKANNGATTTIAKADPQSWGTDLTFATAIEVGNSTVSITGLERYGDPEYLWVLKEDSAWRIVGDEAQQIPLREMASARSEFTGKASTVGNVFMYLNIMRGLSRYYENRLDDMGPNIDDGLQAGYQGPIYHVISYPGRLYAAVSGEDWGFGSFSSIQVHNGKGWHPFYRCFYNADRPLWRLHHQVIPGTTLDRLWVSEGPDVFWLPMPSETYDPTLDDNYKYYHCGMLQTSWYYMNLKEIQKTLNSISVWAEDLVASNQYIEVSHQLANGGYEDVFGTADTSPVEEISISTGIGSNQIQDKAIRFLIVLWTNDETKTPILKATVLEALAHLPDKPQYQAVFVISDDLKDLRGQSDTNDAATVESQLRTWADAGTFLTMRHHHQGGPLDNKTVMVGAPATTPLEISATEGKGKYICEMLIQQVL